MSQKSKRLEGRFAATPIDVMKSDAWRTLPHGARSTLQVIEVQFNGMANGVQNLCRSTCKRYGLNHSRSLQHAKMLEARGLVVKTYTAEYSTARSRVPSQWAIGWRDITHNNNCERATILKAQNQWRRWSAPIIQSVRFERSKRKTACVLNAELVRYCVRFDTQWTKTAFVLHNLLRVWGTPSAFDRYVGCYIFGNHGAGGLPRHGHSLHLKACASFSYNNYCSAFSTTGVKV
jgi:hypothetical protein